jgi:monoglucosyldiacylglycerol epimerase
MALPDISIIFSSISAIGLPIGAIAWQVVLVLASVLVAEVVRDLFHVAGHYWQPLQAGHSLHHKAYRPDLSIVSLEVYRQAQWHNDVPEACVMVTMTAILALLGQSYGLGYALWAGCIYAASFLTTSVARSQGMLLTTDLTHKPGELVTIPSQWTVNRTYHWRHHFDRGEAYYCGTFTLVDKIMGTSLSLKGKTVAVTGASGSLGRSLVAELAAKGAKVVALTTSPQADFSDLGSNIEVLPWQLGAEADLSDRLQKVDILIINHGMNVHSDRDPASVAQSFEVNTFSAWRLMNLFLDTAKESRHKAIKELWINTSEAEVNPAFSPLYELSKRTLGDLITLRRLDAPCIIRKLILGPFKSNLNPIGVMSPGWVAWAIVALAQRDFRNIIVTVNPLTYLIFPIHEILQSLYFRLFSKGNLTPKDNPR